MNVVCKIQHEGWGWMENNYINEVKLQMWLSEQKPDMFALKLKFILLP